MNAGILTVAAMLTVAALFCLLVTGSVHPGLVLLFGAVILAALGAIPGHPRA